MFSRPLRFIALLAIAPSCALAADPPILVFAAASLKTALDAEADAFKAATGEELKISYGGSLALARQIEQGAPADVFVSADEASMDDAAGKQAIKAGSRFDYLSNVLVVVAPKAAAIDALELKASAVQAALGDGKLATGEVTTVPVGKYAKEALTKLALWDVVQPHLAMTDNVRAALGFVAKGEATLGIVYATDAKAEPGVKVVATFPEDSHAPIVYPVALTAASNNPGAQKLIDFLKSDAGRALFTAQGFGAVK